MFVCPLICVFHYETQVENEELKHILWSSVLFYKIPDVETTACILLSTKAVYFILDDSAAMLSNEAGEGHMGGCKATRAMQVAAVFTAIHTTRLHGALEVRGPLLATNNH